MALRENWISRWFRQFEFFPAYLRAIAQQWMNVLFGETILGVIFIIWWALGNPPLVLLFVLAFIVAGFFACHGNHTRLIPRLEIKKVIIQHTPTSLPNDSRTYIHIVPECITDSPVAEVKGHLLRVWRKPEGGVEWLSTEVDEPAELVWSIFGNTLPRTLQPGVLTRLNICWISYINSTLLHLDGIYPLRWEHAFDNVSDTFKFDVRITAKDCSPVDVSVAVKMGEAEAETEATLLP